MTRGYFPVLHGGSESRPDELDTVRAAGAVVASLRRLGFDSEEVRLRLDLQPIADLCGRGPVGVFNLVEALGGRMSLAPLAAMACERFGLRCTGARGAALLATESKLEVKHALLEADIETPRWWRGGERVPATETVIVKPTTEHGSYGVDAASVMRGDRAAAEIAARAERFETAFFAERFIDGREFQISLLREDPDSVTVLPIQETLFEGFAGRARIVDYAAKWEPTDPAYHGTPRRFAVDKTEPELAKALADVGWDVWELFDLDGYARIDVRLSASGEPYVIDVNANPCLAAEAGFMAAAQAGGLGFDDVVERIATAALDQEADRPWRAAV